METIMSYIDNLFRSYPDTPQVRRAREELLGIMEDKYNELKAGGKSENEAIGIVISEFGSMDEIAFELGLDKELAAGQKRTVDFRQEKKLTLEQAKAYLQSQDSFGFKIAAGVVLCICSPVPACIMSALEEANILPGALADAAGGCSLFLMVAVAVGIFITAGIANGRYDMYKKYQIQLDFRTRARIAEEYEAFNQGFGIKITTGVILCIISVLPSVCMEAVFAGTGFQVLRDLSGSSLFILVAGGVFLFITQGVKKSAYDLLLEKGDFAPEKRTEKKGEKLIQAIAAAYWPIVTACYLVWSFVTGKWGFTWIIWVVAGLIFGAISAVISIIFREN